MRLHSNWFRFRLCSCFYRSAIVEVSLVSCNSICDYNGFAVNRSLWHLALFHRTLFFLIFSLLSPYSPFPHFPQYTSFACFLLPNTRKQFCILIVFIFSWDFQSSREKCKQCLCKTVCVCWGARNMQTNCIEGNVEMANTISPYKTSKELLTFVMVTRGDWL